MPRLSAWTKYFLSGQNFFPKLKKYIFACKMDGKLLFSHRKFWHQTNLLLSHLKHGSLALDARAKRHFSKSDM